MNLETLLGVKKPVTDLVAVRYGSLLDFEGKVAAVLSAHWDVVDLVKVSHLCDK